MRLIRQVDTMVCIGDLDWYPLGIFGTERIGISKRIDGYEWINH